MARLSNTGKFNIYDRTKRKGVTYEHKIHLSPPL